MIVCILSYWNFFSQFVFLYFFFLQDGRKKNIETLQTRRKKLSLFIIGFCSNMSNLQVVKNVLSMSEKEISKQNNVEKFEIREQNKNKTEAKWKYKVRIFQPSFWHGFANWCSLPVKANNITILYSPAVRSSDEAFWMRGEMKLSKSSCLHPQSFKCSNKLKGCLKLKDDEKTQSSKSDLRTSLQSNQQK